MRRERYKVPHYPCEEIFQNKIRGRLSFVSKNCLCNEYLGVPAQIVIICIYRYRNITMYSHLWNIGTFRYFNIVCLCNYLVVVLQGEIFHVKEVENKRGGRTVDIFALSV